MPMPMPMPLLMLMLMLMLMNTLEEGLRAQTHTGDPANERRAAAPALGQRA